MLIGLNGLLQSGKDTTYSIIRELYPHAERLAFADKLKVSAAAALGADVETVERLKVDEGLSFMLVPIDDWVLSADVAEAREGRAVQGIKAFTMRQFLQRYGTEAHRDVFGDDFWVKQTLPDGFDHSRRIVVLTDCRFLNEADRIHELGGCVVEIVRPNCRPRLPGSNNSGHTSERGIGGAVGYRVTNDGTLNDLRCKVRGLMTMLREREANGYEIRRTPGCEPHRF